MAPDRRPAKLQHRAAPRETGQSSAQPKNSLLDLPIEIRMLILRELLWDPEPLFFARPRNQAEVNRTEASYWISMLTKLRSQSLHPNILSVCKQLHREGEPILYDNTVRCVIFHGSWIDVTPEMTHESLLFLSLDYHDFFAPPYHMEGEAAFDRLPSGLRHKMRKFHLDVMCGYETFEDDEHEMIPEWLKQAVYRIALFLLEHEQYRHLTFNLGLFEIGGGSDANDSDDPDNPANSHTSDSPRPEIALQDKVRRRLLQPFTYLRDRSSVRVEGVDAELESRMQLITTDQPAFNLHKLYDALEDCVDETFVPDLMETDVTYGDYLESRRWMCSEAMEEGRDHDFLRHRAEILSIIAMRNMIAMRKAVALDTDLIPAKYRGPFLHPGRDLTEVPLEAADQDESQLSIEVQDLVDEYKRSAEPGYSGRAAQDDRRIYGRRASESLSD